MRTRTTIFRATKAERAWALEKSAAHCWYCGVLVHKLFDSNDERVEPSTHGFACVLLNQEDGRTAENIVCMCIGCSSARAQAPTIDSYRFQRMRAQYDPMLTKQDVHTLVRFGLKPRFRYHYFWFESLEGIRIVSAAMNRKITLECNSESNF